MAQLATIEKTNTQVARPLHVLAPLIKKDLADAEAAAERASEPYYRAAGEKLIEAKAQLPRGEFGEWRKLNFKNLGERDAQRCMALVRAEPNFTTPSIENRRNGGFNLREAIGEPRGGQPPAWREPVKETIERAKREAERLREEALTRAQERDAERQLALRLIDIGFKVLSKELHPDKGGSRDAMQRLNRVRDRLKSSA